MTTRENTPATLYLLCGKMASGKSTLAAELADTHNAILIGEDDLLAKLYPNEITDVADYVSASGKLKSAVHTLLIDILLSGTSLVLDFPANTVSQRNWFKRLIEASGAQHELHYLDVPEADCKDRLARRAIEQPARTATDTPDMFDAITRYFEAPGENEGFNIVEQR